MKIVAINSSLSAYEPQRAILMSERIRGMSNRAYTLPIQIEHPVKGYKMMRHQQHHKLDNQIKEGEKFTPNEKARRSPFKRYDP